MAFPTTRWTLLADATLDGDAVGRRALDDLCTAYRQPVVAFLTSRGYRNQELDDLAQEFFLRWLRQRSWKRADRERGRFRTFLLGAVTHMLAHHHARENAAKRGGGVETDSLDELGEAGFELAETEIAPSPEFDRAWAAALVANVFSQIEDEYRARDRAEAFAVLRRFLPSGGEPLSLEDAARLMDTNVGAVKAAVHRLRERFREQVRAAVAATVGAPHEVDEELLYLRTLMMHGLAGNPPVEAAVEQAPRVLDPTDGAPGQQACAPLRIPAAENRNTP